MIHTLTINLFHTDPPEYNISSNVFTVVQGETFDLELGLDGNPFPGNETWLFNGQMLMMISGIELGVNFIRIQMVTPLDQGTYTVQSSNAAGTGMISFQLQVEGIQTNTPSLMLISHYVKTSILTVPTTTVIGLPSPTASTFAEP